MTDAEIDAMPPERLYAWLWEKVPETRPVRSSTDPPGYRLSFDEVVAPYWEHGTRKYPEESLPWLADAVDIAQVAAQNWLSSHTIWRRHGDEIGYPMDEYGDNWFRFRGPTLHHALCKAALAVAGVKA